MKKKKYKLITGTLSKHRRGFGFVIPDDKDDTQKGDIFISPDDMSTAMNQDKVTVRITSGSTGKVRGEGIIEKVVERANKEVVGTLFTKGDYGYIIPARSKGTEEIIVSRKFFKGAKSGDIVAADITKWPSKGRKAEGGIKEIISKKGEAGGDVKALIRAFQVRGNFPEKVMSEVESISQSVSAKDVENRRDLRSHKIITIDGSDAKDLDDAISVEKLANGNFLLGVHISDVSHYVKEGNPLDKEALKRGTSIYLIDWVVPMLPPQLSNGICSLSPGEDRLTLSVNMEINKEGQIVSHEIFESVIRSCERMTYTDVSDIIENKNQELIEKYRHIYPLITAIHDLASALRNKRREKGSLDFDIGEAQITLNEKGLPVNIALAERRIANRIIEEFMLAANMTIAEHFYHLDLPFVFRVHEKPSADRIIEFKNFLLSMGIKLKGNPENLHPKAFNEVLDMVSGTGKEHVVNTVMLRSMKKAFYNVECLGHFGLGMKYYCHFTAPIRRYPDLIIHRIIKEALYKGLGEGRIKALGQKTLEASDNSSLMERKAEELEREVEKLKKAQYMSYKIGDQFSGIISGVTSFGFFVQLENTIEGLVRVDSLNDDYYIYEEERYRFVGERTKKIYGLGDPVTIIVESVDMTSREIQFILNDPGSRRKA